MRGRELDSSLDDIGADPVLGYRMQVRFADEAAIFAREEQNDGGRRQTADLKQDEHRVVAMQCEASDEHAADQPHDPGAAADSRRTVFFCQMHYLW
jgi:hypothetical protein